MKKSLIILNLIIFTIIFAGIANATADKTTYLTSGSLRVSMINQDPDPAGPGEYVELRWMVTNMGSTPLENVEFRLLENYPIKFLGSDNGYRNAGTIQGQQKGEEGVIVHFKVKIDEDASEGVNDLVLMYKYSGSEWSKLDDFEMRVESVDAAVIIDRVKLDPVMIPAGQTGKLTLSMKNIADSLMKDISVKLDLTLSTLSTSATTDAAMLYDALPFAPTTSSNNKRIISIRPGELKDVTYDLRVYPDAPSRVYKVPVMITYKDELETEYTKTETIGVVVGSDPDLYVVIDNSNLVAGEKSGKVSFKFINKGVTDIKFLDVTLTETDEYKIVSANKEYIGNVDSDDYDNVDFELYLNNNVDPDHNGMIDFPVHISFMDANNIAYEKDIVVKYRINTAEQKGDSKNKSGLIIIIVLIIMICGIILYRKWIKKHKIKK